MDDAGGHRSSPDNPCLRMVRSLLDVCRRGTLELTSESMLSVVKAVCIASLKFVDKRALFEDVLPGTFIDWGFVDDQRSRGVSNVLGDSALWSRLVGFVVFAHPGTHQTMEAEMCTEHPLLHCIYSSLRASGCMDPRAERAARGRLSFDDVCKLFVLINVEGLSTKHVTDLYVSSVLGREAPAVGNGITSALADTRQPESSYVKTFKHVFSLMSLDGRQLEAAIVQHRASADLARETVTLKNASTSRKNRVSLRSFLQDGDGGLGGLDQGLDEISSSSGGACTTSQGFCNSVRFPNRMSKVLRLRCYLLACMCHLFDFTLWSHLLVSGTILESMNRNPVEHPDPDSVFAAVNTLVLSKAPFPELVAFRHRCHSAFAFNHWKTLSLTQYLHLYVCSYMKKDIWKACWRRVFPVMSTQISREVEAFVQETPFAVEEVLAVVKTSSPFSV